MSSGLHIGSGTADSVSPVCVSVYKCVQIRNASYTLPFIKDGLLHSSGKRPLSLSIHARMCLIPAGWSIDMSSKDFDGGLRVAQQ